MTGTELLQQKLVEALETATQTNLALQQLTQQLYERGNRQVRPVFPWVLLRVLSKEQKIGSIFCPDVDHNKTTHEGIVVATWLPWTKELGVIEQNGVKKTRSVEMRSNLELGDHVLFHHWAGLPLRGLDDKYWRVVKEVDWSPMNEGGIFATVQYDEKDAKPENLLKVLLAETLAGVGPEGEIDAEQLTALMAARIEERMLLIDRAAHSVTLSGR
jgi:co-chaperonin GroES (HSP10)